jgi:hypothetical protein
MLICFDHLSSCVCIHLTMLACLPCHAQVIIGSAELKANHNIDQHVMVVSEYEKYGW